MIIRSFLYIVICVITLSACNQSPIYERYSKIPSEGWSQDSIYNFVVDIDDTSKAYEIYVNLRNNSNYPYSNIYLFRKIESKQGVEYTDTVNYTLADAYGKWYGEGIGDLKTHHFTFNKQAVKFKRTGKYNFSIQQGMRESSLIGIENIGLSIFVANKNEDTDG